MAYLPVGWSRFKTVLLMRTILALLEGYYPLVFLKDVSSPQPSCLFLFLIYLFIYLFMAALGLHCCTRAFSSRSEQGLLFIAVHGLLFAVASLVVVHGL